MTQNNWLMLACFAALVLAASLHLLSASGHFPKEERVPQLRGTVGGLLLHGSMIVTAVAVIIAIMIVAAALPWYAAVLGGGIAALMAPLILPNFSDEFVDGIPALLVFALCTLAALGGMGLLR